MGHFGMKPPNILPNPSQTPIPDVSAPVAYSGERIDQVYKIVQNSTHIFMLALVQNVAGPQLNLVKINKLTFGETARIALFITYQSGEAIPLNAPLYLTDLQISADGNYVYVVATNYGIRTYSAETLVELGIAAFGTGWNFKSIVFGNTRFWTVMQDPAGMLIIDSWPISTGVVTQNTSGFQRPGIIHSLCYSPLANEVRMSITEGGKNYIVRFSNEGTEIGKVLVDLFFSHLVGSPTTNDLYATIFPGSSCYRLIDGNFNTGFQAVIGVTDPAGTIVPDGIQLDTVKNYVYIVSSASFGYARFTGEPRFFSGGVFFPTPMHWHYALDSASKKLFGVSQYTIDGYIHYLFTDVTVNVDAIYDLEGAETTESGSIKLSWTNISAGEVSTLIYRKTAAGAFTQIGSVAPGISTFTDTAAENEVEYSYYVVESDGATYGLQSNIVIVTGAWSSEYPESPSGQTTRPKYDPLGTASGSRYTLQVPNRVKLYWTYRVFDNCGDVLNRIDGFKIFKSNGSLFIPVATLGAGIREWEDTVGDLSAQYSYYVLAFNSQRDGSPSATYEIDLSPLRIPSPSILSKVSSSSEIRILWTSATDAAGYYVYRRNKSAEGDWRLLSTTSLFSYEDSDFRILKSRRIEDFEYKVIAYNTYGESIDSNIISVSKEDT